MKRLAVALAVALLSVLLCEGLLSLACRTSLRALFAPPRPALDALLLPELPGDRERDLAAARTPGPYRVPEDPLVSYTLKKDADLAFLEGKLDVRVHTDELGLRARPGPPPPAEALRIVVLGDSVAFGLGLADDETLGAQLERLLAAALPARPIACTTVAVPSWNGRNAWRFLLDHLEHFRPDIVLYLPIDNDLEDSYGVNEAGQRRTAEDPAVPLPLLHVRPEWAYLVLRTRELRAAGDDPVARIGPEVLDARLSPTSRWRFADLVQTIALGQGAWRARARSWRCCPTSTPTSTASSRPSSSARRSP
jgi:hypothetical protein